MRTLIHLSILLLIAAPSYAWMNLIPNYKKQFNDSDFVGVVRVTRVIETGVTNKLRANSLLHFRELEVSLEVVSQMKGESAQAIKCRLYRFPTTEESSADLGAREGPMADLMATPWQSGMFVPRQLGHYMGYLKRSQAGYYYPVGGFERAIYGLVELKVPRTTRPDGSDDSEDAVTKTRLNRTETNSTPAAVGSRR